MNNYENCKHCNATCDSFGNYVSHYCHIKQENIKGFDDKTTFCETCKDYEPRNKSHKGDK